MTFSTHTHTQTQNRMFFKCDNFGSVEVGKKVNACCVWSKLLGRASAQ